MTVGFDTKDQHGTTKAGRRCKACDGGVYDKDTRCMWCGAREIVEPYPPATTMEMAIAEVFEHDTKSSGIVGGIVRGSWPEQHGSELLAGQVAATLQRGTGEWPSINDCEAAVKLAIAERRRN
jgi:hypothetical protein